MGKAKTNQKGLTQDKVFRTSVQLPLIFGSADFNFSGKVYEVGTQMMAVLSDREIVEGTFCTLETLNASLSFCVSRCSPLSNSRKEFILVMSCLEQDKDLTKIFGELLLFSA